VLDFIELHHRVLNPDGSFDKQGRWYPDIQCPHCASIRAPSRAFPYSLLVHCRTAKHVYHAHRLGTQTGVSELEFVRLCRRSSAAFHPSVLPKRNMLANLIAKTGYGFKSSAVHQGLDQPDT
jgi:hypothetical protein